MTSIRRRRNTNQMTYEPWKDQARCEIKDSVPDLKTHHRPVNWHWPWQSCLWTPLSALHDEAWDSQWTTSCNRHPQHRRRPKIYCTVSARPWEMPTLCAAAKAQPRGGDQFPHFTVQQSPRPADEEHHCSLQLLMKRVKGLKYPLLVPPQPGYSTHKKCRSWCMARCFSKGGMCNLIYLQQFIYTPFLLHQQLKRCTASMTQMFRDQLL